MDAKKSIGFCGLLALFLGFVGCGGEQAIDFEALKSQPKAFVGSDTCKMCHLEHYDSWRMTLHSRMTQDVQINHDAVIPHIDEKMIREDLAKLDDLKIPVDQIHIPKTEEILYSIGSQWKQQYIVKKGDTMYIAPIQYNMETHRWVNYHEDDWDKRPWLLTCGGCHTTGIDLEKQTFKEPAVGCEACHGKGSWHAALPKTAVFEKRTTIVNPSKLTMGVAVQICGSCHNRGKSVMKEGAEWPVGYEPGRTLGAYFKSTSYADGDEENMYVNEFSKSNEQQYIDWTKSQHYREGVTCTSCHFVHQMGMPPTRSQTVFAGSKQCLTCHVAANKLKSHNFHSFANCVGCHMPRIATSAEPGDIHSHVFTALVPRDTILNPEVPNSCQSCHKHKGQDLKKLQREAYEEEVIVPGAEGEGEGEGEPEGGGGGGVFD